MEEYVNIRISKETHEALKVLGARRGIKSTTSMIAGILYEWLEIEQKKEVAAMKAVERMAKKQGKV